LIENTTQNSLFFSSLWFFLFVVRYKTISHVDEEEDQEGREADKPKALVSWLCSFPGQFLLHQ